MVPAKSIVDESSRDSESFTLPIDKWPVLR